MRAYRVRPPGKGVDATAASRNALVFRPTTAAAPETTTATAARGSQ